MIPAEMELKLFNYIKDISNEVVQECDNVINKVNILNQQTQMVDVQLYNAVNQLDILSDYNFIENRVEEIENPNVSQTECPTETAETDSSEQTRLVLQFAMLAVDRAYVKLDLNTVCLKDDLMEDSEDEMEVSNAYGTMDVYTTRPLPFVIGSDDFENDYFIGVSNYNDDSTELGSISNKNEVNSIASRSLSLSLDSLIEDLVDDSRTENGKSHGFAEKHAFMNSIFNDDISDDLFDFDKEEENTKPDTLKNIFDESENDDIFSKEIVISQVPKRATETPLGSVGSKKKRNLFSESESDESNIIPQPKKATNDREIKIIKPMIYRQVVRSPSGSSLSGKPSKGISKHEFSDKEDDVSLPKKHYMSSKSSLASSSDSRQGRKIPIIKNDAISALANILQDSVKTVDFQNDENPKVLDNDYQLQEHQLNSVNKDQTQEKTMVTSKTITKKSLFDSSDEDALFTKDTSKPIINENVVKEDHRFDGSNGGGPIIHIDVKLPKKSLFDSSDDEVPITKTNKATNVVKSDYKVTKEKALFDSSEDQVKTTQTLKTTIEAPHIREILHKVDDTSLTNRNEGVKVLSTRQTDDSEIKFSPSRRTDSRESSLSKEPKAAESRTIYAKVDTKKDTEETSLTNTSKVDKPEKTFVKSKSLFDSSDDEMIKRKDVGEMTPKMNVKDSKVEKLLEYSQTVDKMDKPTNKKTLPNKEHTTLFDSSDDDFFSKITKNRSQKEAVSVDSAKVTVESETSTVKHTVRLPSPALSTSKTSMEQKSLSTKKHMDILPSVPFADSPKTGSRNTSPLVNEITETKVLQETEDVPKPKMHQSYKQQFKFTDMTSNPLFKKQNVLHEPSKPTKTQTVEHIRSTDSPDIPVPYSTGGNTNSVIPETIKEITRPQKRCAGPRGRSLPSNLQSFFASESSGDKPLPGDFFGSNTSVITKESSRGTLGDHTTGGGSQFEDIPENNHPPQIFSENEEKGDILGDRLSFSGLGNDLSVETDIPVSYESEIISSNIEESSLNNLLTKPPNIESCEDESLINDVIHSIIHSHITETDDAFIHNQITNLVPHEISETFNDESLVPHEIPFSNDALVPPEISETFNDDSLVLHEIPFSNDSLVPHEISETFNDDSLVPHEIPFSNDELVPHEISEKLNDDGLAPLEIPETLNTDSLVSTEIPNAFNDESLLPPEIPETFDDESLSLPEITETFDDESSLPPEITETFDDESSLPPEITETFDDESSLPPEITETFDDESSLPPEITETFDDESLSLPEIPETFDDESLLPPEIPETFDDESLLPPEIQETLKTDSLVSPETPEGSNSDPLIHSKMGEIYNSVPTRTGSFNNELQIPSVMVEYDIEPPTYFIDQRNEGIRNDITEYNVYSDQPPPTQIDDLKYNESIGNDFEDSQIIMSAFENEDPSSFRVTPPICEESDFKDTQLNDLSFYERIESKDDESSYFDQPPPCLVSDSQDDYFANEFYLLPTLEVTGSSNREDLPLVEEPTVKDFNFEEATHDLNVPKSLFFDETEGNDIPPLPDLDGDSVEDEMLPVEEEITRDDILNCEDFDEFMDFEVSDVYKRDENDVDLDVFFEVSEEL